MGAVADGTEYRACSEWREFLRDYDTDGAILSEIGNGIAGLQEEYSLVYGCYSREMADKVDEICTEFGLSRLKGFYLAEDYVDLCGRAGIGDVCSGMTGNVSWEFYNGYLYDDGTFHMEGRAEIREAVQGMQEPVSRVSDYQMIRTMKGSFNPLTLNVGVIEGYREWSYVTERGELVLLANSSDQALIIIERQNSLIVVNVLGDLLEDTFQISDKMLEEMAEAFDFSAIP